MKSQNASLVKTLMKAPLKSNVAYEKIIAQVKWVKIRKYCELSGDTAHGVYNRRRRNQWFDGVHCKIGPDGNLWINLMEVEKWVENTN